MNKKLPAAVLSLFCAAAFAAANEIVVLKGGKVLELSRPYVVRGSQAVMTLKDGTVVSVASSEIDAAATRAARSAPKVPAASTNALTPVEAARAQQNRPAARVKIGDADVGHVLEGAEAEGAAAAAGGAEGESAGDAKLEVVDFDQSPSGKSVAVKGTIRNSGKAAAQNVALSIAAIDDAGKTVASTTAAVSAGSLDAGSSATFTATLPMSARAGTLRFTPRWSSAAPAAPAPATGTAASGAPAPGAPAASAAPGAPAGAATAPASAKPAPPPPAPQKKEPAYKPQPDYAPPPANAPMAPTGDIHTGYIPGAHEETPPPPPPPQ